MRIGVDVEQGLSGGGGDGVDHLGPASFADVDDALEHRPTLSQVDVGLALPQFDFSVPGQSPLPWDTLAEFDAVYFTAGDGAALAAARAARTLVATMRAREALHAGVQLDALVASANDAGETYSDGDIEPPPRAVVRTEGAGGGSVAVAGSATRWAAAELPGTVVDAYGAGDCFAAGFTFALGKGATPAEAAKIGAECGAACMTRRGPYGAHGGPI
jgi:ribokinase